MYSLVHKSLFLKYQFSFFECLSKVSITHLICISFNLPEFRFTGVPKCATCNGIKSSNGWIFSLLFPTYQLSISCLRVIIGNFHVVVSTCKIPWWKPIVRVLLFITFLCIGFRLWSITSCTSSFRWTSSVPGSRTSSLSSIRHKSSCYLSLGHKSSFPLLVVTFFMMLSILLFDSSISPRMALLWNSLSPTPLFQEFCSCHSLFPFRYRQFFA